MQEFGRCSLLLILWCAYLGTMDLERIVFEYNWVSESLKCNLLFLCFVQICVTFLEVILLCINQNWIVIMVSRTVQLISAYMCDDLLMWDLQGLSNTSMTPCCWWYTDMCMLCTWIMLARLLIQQSVGLAVWKKGVKGLSVRTTKESGIKTWNFCQWQSGLCIRIVQGVWSVIWLVTYNRYFCRCELVFF